jgi:hypothetical protein
VATLQDLRRRVGELTGDLDIFTGTASGSTTTLVDSLNGYMESTSFNGRFGYFPDRVTATGSRTVRITSSDKATTTVTFTPAVTSATAAGTVMELYNRDNQGPRPEQIHRVINSAIESVSNAALTEVVSSESSFDFDSPTISVGATWRRVIAVEWQHPDTEDWITIPEADWVDTADRANRTIRLDNFARFDADTNMVRLRGYTAASALSADTDETSVDAEWLVHRAAADLLLNLATNERVVERRAADYRATSQYLNGLANVYRAKVPRTIHGASGVVFP